MTVLTETKGCIYKEVQQSQKICERIFDSTPQLSRIERLHEDSHMLGFAICRGGCRYSDEEYPYGSNTLSYRYDR
jgi:hypothetical protein